MTWTTIPDLKGRCYIPRSRETGKKHTCADCFACQNCSNERCSVCIGGRQEPPPDSVDDGDH